MKCDSLASLLAHTFTSPCFDRKPNTKVTSKMIVNYSLVESIKVNMSNLCDIYTILSISCVFPMLNFVHDSMKFVHGRDVL